MSGVGCACCKEGGAIFFFNFQWEMLHLSVNFS